jgi:hypothetical protein
VHHYSSFSFVYLATSAEGLLPDPSFLQIQVSHHLHQYSKDDEIQLPCFCTALLIHQDCAGLDICSWKPHHDFGQSQEGIKIWHRHPLRFEGLVQVGFPLMARLREGLVFERFSPNFQHCHFD